MKTIQWNRKAVEHAKAQGFDDPKHAICSGCGTTPKLRQFGRYQCECGDLEGLRDGMIRRALRSISPLARRYWGRVRSWWQRR